MSLPERYRPTFGNLNVAIIRSEYRREATIYMGEQQLEIRTRIKRPLQLQVPLDVQEADIQAPDPEFGFRCCLQHNHFLLPEPQSCSPKTRSQEDKEDQKKVAAVSLCLPSLSYMYLIGKTNLHPEP